MAPATRPQDTWGGVIAVVPNLDTSLAALEGIAALGPVGLNNAVGVIWNPADSDSFLRLQDSNVFKDWLIRNYPPVHMMALRDRVWPHYPQMGLPRHALPEY